MVIVASDVVNESESLALREAAPTDLPALLALKLEVVDRALSGSHSVERLDCWKGRFATGEYFRERLASTERQTSFFVIGPSRTALQGMVALKSRNGSAYIGDLYVRDAGRGFGRQLLHHVLAVARRRGYEIAWADVFAGNTVAERLFQSEGFTLDHVYGEKSLGISVQRLRAHLTVPS